MGASSPYGSYGRGRPFISAPVVSSWPANVASAVAWGWENAGAQPSVSASSIITPGALTWGWENASQLFNVNVNAAVVISAALAWGWESGAAQPGVSAGANIAPGALTWGWESADPLMSGGTATIVAAALAWGLGSLSGPQSAVSTSAISTAGLTWGIGLSALSGVSAGALVGVAFVGPALVLASPRTSTLVAVNAAPTWEQTATGVFVPPSGSAVITAPPTWEQLGIYFPAINVAPSLIARVLLVQVQPMRLVVNPQPLRLIVKPLP